MITTTPRVNSMSSSVTQGATFTINITTFPTAGGQRSCSAQGAPGITILTPAPGATPSLPFTSTGKTLPGATVALVNDSTGNSLGSPVTADGSGNYSFTVTSAGT